MPSSIALIVGLGNPGRDYTKTRHNAGAWFVEHLAFQRNVAMQKEAKFQSLCGSFFLKTEECKLLLPQTYMNASGKAVQAFSNYYQIPSSAILIAHDDLDFPCGDVRLKLGGGHGGHNGLRDIIKHLGTPDFYRLRIGIDHPGHKDLVHNYVLGRPTNHEKEKIMTGIEKASSVVPNLLKGEYDKAKMILNCTA